jgi:hypothetical protein
MDGNEHLLFSTKAQDAEERRWRELEFASRFTNNQKLIDDYNQKRIDRPHFEANPYYMTVEFQQAYRLVFLDILLDQYVESYNAKIKQLIIPESENVKKKTQIFLQSQNIFKKIIDGLLIKTGTETDKVTFSDIWNECKMDEDYRTLTMVEKRLHSRDECYSYLADTYDMDTKDTRAKKATGVRLRTKEDIETEEEPEKTGEEENVAKRPRITEVEYNEVTRCNPKIGFRGDQIKGNDKRGPYYCKEINKQRVRNEYGIYDEGADGKLYFIKVRSERYHKEGDSPNSNKITDTCIINID